MKPITLNIFDVFQMERQYLVPLFQRPYVWNQDDQWKPLWEDVKAKADEVLQHAADENYPIRKHFLGAVVMSQVNTSIDHINAMEVIDGQQRLTTLQVLLWTLRDYAKEQGHSGSLKTLDRLTENTCELEEKTERYKVWPTTSDRAVFEGVYTAGSPAQVEKAFPLIKEYRKKKYNPRPRLVDAYLYFYDEIESFCTCDTDAMDDGSVELESAETDEEKTQSAESKQRLSALIRAITRHLEIVAIELQSGDDPQVIFETLNARGEPLLPSDLLRNFVFLEATRRKEDVPKLYQTYWSAFDASNGHDSFWKQEQTQGRLKRPRLDLFIFHYLTAQTKREIPIKHLYQEFRDWWLKNRSGVSVADGLNELQTASVQYRKFLEPQGQTRLSVFCDRLQALDVGTVYPILLLLTATQTAKVVAADLPGILSDLESYLVRRYVCDLTSKNYNNIFLSLLKKLGEEDSITRESLRKALSALQGDSARWPDDTEFEKEWMSTQMYQVLGSRRTALILKALDLQMETSKQEQIHVIGDLSIEHVMPQSWSDDKWPLYSDDTTSFTSDVRDAYLHTIGNLTLLTKPLNSSVSNGSFAKKRPEIAKQSKLRMNAYFQDIEPADVWDEVTIWERSEVLFQTALQIWPAPDATT